MKSGILFLKEGTAMGKMKIFMGALTFLLIFGFGAVNAGAASGPDPTGWDHVEIMEELVPENDWVPAHLEFKVYNTDYGINEFAIGNNTVLGAYVDTSVQYAPQYLTQSAVATKDGSGHWTAWQQWQDPVTFDVFSTTRDLDWLDSIPAFHDEYSSALLYTSYAYDSDNAAWGYTGFLEHGIWDNNGWTEWEMTQGYQGLTDMPQSSFAMHYADGSVFTGETSAVPIPGALWLLGSGLFGLVAVRRRKDKV